MTGRPPVVLVTGVTGFVGRHLAQFLNENGWVVRGAVRRTSGADTDVLVESISGTTDWEPALKGVDAVVHLAARVPGQNEKRAESLYRSLNIDGTLQLARCAAKAGVRDFIFVSSVFVHGRSSGGRRPLREDDVLRPSGVYGMSKASAEAGLQRLAQQGNMRVSVIRPPLIYGPGAKGNFGLLVKAVKLGVPLPFAAIRNKRAFLSVTNLCSFISHRLSNAGEIFEVFLVADDEQVSTSEFIRRLAKAAGKAPRLFPLPTWILASLFRLGGQGKASESFIGSLELDLSRAASIGWRPQLTLDQGLKQALVSTNL